MSSNYWSSTTNANNTNNAWHVNFNNGNDNNNNKSNNNYVRAVRGGKCSLLAFESIFNAYLDCRKRKRGTINALRFEYRLLDNLFELARELQKGSYRPSRSVCFVTTRPKSREIFAADFKDRIVHHLVVRELEKIWEPKFIYDSYASRKGKGTHAAVKRLQRFMLKATRNQKTPAWYLKLDIRSFFMSIDRDILFEMLMKAISGQNDANALALRQILPILIYHDPTQDYYFRGDPAILRAVPAHKSLFHVPGNKGLPIGNLTSQFFANAYLNELDQFVKHRLKCRHYVRYVDDFVLVASSPETLQQWRRRIEKFLDSRLSLSLKDSGVIRRVSAGADFLGYIVRPAYRLARRRVVNNLRSKLAAYEKKLVSQHRINGRLWFKINVYGDIPVRLRQTLAAYLGHFKHANTHNLITALFQKYEWLDALYFRNGTRIQDRFRCRGDFRTLRGQVTFFRSRIKDALLLFEVGRYFELYNRDAAVAARIMGIRCIDHRTGMRRAAGFPARYKRVMLRKLLSAGQAVAVVAQGREGKYIKTRHVNEIWRPASQGVGQHAA